MVGEKLLFAVMLCFMHKVIVIWRQRFVARSFVSLDLQLRSDAQLLRFVFSAASSMSNILGTSGVKGDNTRPLTTGRIPCSVVTEMSM